MRDLIRDFTSIEYLMPSDNIIVLFWRFIWRKI